jgi:hypothetical protein
MIDFDELRGSWGRQEINKELAALLREPVSSIIARIERRERRKKLQRRIRRILVQAALAVPLALAAVQLYAGESRKLPSQTAAFILALAVACALQLVDRAREKYRDPKFWLSIREFRQDEHRRVGRNIYFAWWNTVLLSLGILCIAVYVSAMLSAPLRIACYAGTPAAMLALLIYNYRRISDLKFLRDRIGAELDDWNNLENLDDLQPE